MGDVLLDLVGFLEKAHRQRFAAEVAFVERPFDDRFVEMLQLRKCELRRQQFEADRLIADLPFEPFQRDVENLCMIEGERRRVGHGEPSGIAGVGSGLHAMIADIDQSLIGHGDDSLARVALDIAEGVELLEEDP